MKTILKQTRKNAEQYLAGVNEQRAFPNAQAMANMSHFDEQISESGYSAQETLDLLHRYGSPATVASNGGRYFGFVIGGALPVTIGANWLATAWDQCAGIKVLSPIGAKLEEVCSNWLLEILDLERDSAVGFVTGATMANFTGLAAARHALLKRKGWNVGTQGLYGAPEIKVVVGGEVHVSVEKALSLLGLGSARVIKVPADDQGRMLADQLPELDDMTIVCTQVGNVNSGASDPVAAVCSVAEKAGAWVHVDAAFGLWARASNTHKHLTEGVELADSIATDLHKWLNVPYDSGVVICKHKDLLREAMTIDAAYIQQDLSRQPYYYTPGMSRRARGVEAWAALRFLGRKGVEDLIDRCCAFAQTFTQRFSSAGFSVLNEVKLNQVVISFGSDEQTQAVIDAIHEDSTFWAGGTNWQGQVGLRISVSSWATTSADVELCCDKLIELANNVCKPG